MNKFSRAGRMIEMVKSDEKKNVTSEFLEPILKDLRENEEKMDCDIFQWPKKHNNNTETSNFDKIFVPIFFDSAVRHETASGLDFLTNNVRENLRKSLKLEKRKTELYTLNDFDADDYINDPDYVLPLSKPSSPEFEDTLEERHIQEETLGQIIEPKKESKNASKRKRNNGKSYMSRSGKIVDERKCIPLDECWKKCKTKITYEQQKQTFDRYWSLGSYNQRILFISSLIVVAEKKTTKLNKSLTNPRNRNFSSTYYIEIESNRINVCQKCFRISFGETDSFLKNIIKKKLNYPSNSFTDCRGKLEPPNKLSEEKILEIKNHINNFPAYESHYSRRDTTYKYLNPDLTIQKMYSLYCQENNNPIISLSKYSEIFREMKLKFKTPKIDTCKNCDILKAQIDIAEKGNEENLRSLKEEQEKHHAEAEMAYKCKKVDKVKALNDSSFKIYTFDLQQCLPTPHLQTSVSFYKRQLWTYNLTVHDCGTGEPFCFMWHEAIAARGGNEIASCIFKHLKYIEKNSQVEAVTFYSDCCPGQNKNSFVSTMFKVFIENSKTIKTIDHKFLVPGHTHMECDTDHSVIERRKRKTTAKIHHSRDWFQLVRSCGKLKPFTVIEMEQSHFLNFSSILKKHLTWKNTNTNSEKFIWKNIKWLRYIKNDFDTILYKTSLLEEESFKELIIRRKRGHSTIFCNEIQPINTEPLKISKEKYKDLLDLLPLVDPCFHNFYQTLKSDDSTNIHPDLVEEDDEHLE